MIFEEGIKHVGTLFNLIGGKFDKKVKDHAVKQHKPLSQDGILLGTKHPFNKVTMKRDWKTTQESFQETNIMVDSVLNIISKLDNVPRLQLIENTHSLVNYREKPFQVTKDVFAKVETIIDDPETGTISSVELSLLSNHLSSSEILKWVRQVYVLYKEQIKNSLGDAVYFFDNKSKETGDPRGGVPGLDESMRTAQKALKIATASKQLGFVKSPFYSNKTFANIFGPEVREVEERVNFFLNNKDWCDVTHPPSFSRCSFSPTPQVRPTRDSLSTWVVAVRDTRVGEDFHHPRDGECHLMMTTTSHKHLTNVPRRPT